MINKRVTCPCTNRLACRCNVWPPVGELCNMSSTQFETTRNWTDIQAERHIRCRRRTSAAVFATSTLVSGSSAMQFKEEQPKYLARRGRVVTSTRLRKLFRATRIVGVLNTSVVGSLLAVAASRALIPALHRERSFRHCIESAHSGTFTRGTVFEEHPDKDVVLLRTCSPTSQPACLKKKNAPRHGRSGPLPYPYLNWLPTCPFTFTSLQHMVCLPTCADG